MSERYTKLFALSKDLYIDGSPVVISAGALLKDNDTNSVLVQLKFKSICRKVIKAVTVKIIPMDSAGRELGEKIEHKFLDISAKRNDEFAQKEPVYLSDNSTRAFLVYVSEVIFDDNSIWSCEDAGWESLSDEEIRFGDNELFKQYKMTYGAYAGKQPVYMNSIWKCTCGYINNSDEDKCQNCNVEIGKLKAFDMEQLKADCSARLEKEEQARQEAKRNAEEEQKRLEAKNAERERERQRLEAERKESAKKRNKKIAIAAGAAAVCIIVGVITIKVIIPEARYSKAISLIETESYDDAVVILEKLGEYKDSASVLADATEARNISYYDKALTLIENESYDEALEMLDKLDKYKDSPNLKDKVKVIKNNYEEYVTQYEAGVSLFESGEYEKAATEFKSISEFRDSKTYLEKLEKILDEKYLSQYEKAVELFENGSFNEAKEIFKELGDYRDVKQYIYKLSIKKGDTITFGKYDWKVIDVNEQSALIITVDCVNELPMEEKDSLNYVTWEQCSLRKYLNHDFLNEFSNEEKAKIIETTVSTSRNQEFDISGGNDTADKVFLLSIDEVKNLFSSKDDKIANIDGRRCDWWLRSPGKKDTYFAYYDSSIGSEMIKDEGTTGGAEMGVRPAMWISLE